MTSPAHTLFSMHARAASVWISCAYLTNFERVFHFSSLNNNKNTISGSRTVLRGLSVTLILLFTDHFLFCLFFVLRKKSPKRLCVRNLKFRTFCVSPFVVRRLHMPTTFTHAK